MDRAAKDLQRGVSLVEAVVALAVMAFGILGVVGVQSTLRFNADVAKQRAEAVRIAQEDIEAWRGFTVLTMPSPPNGHVVAFADIQTDANPFTASGTNTNTTFSVMRRVTTVGGSAARALTIEVSWADRSGATQSVVLNSQVSGILPEVAGSLSLAPKNIAGSTPVRGRNLAVPANATDLGNGTSSYVPPGGGSGVSWIFNNATGLITTICNPLCVAGNYALLAGYVRFAQTTTAPGPTSVDSETPSGAAIPLSVAVDITVPSTATILCFQPSITPFSHVPYACAVPLDTATPHVWSGQSRLGGLLIAGAADPVAALATKYRVCRYTPAANNAAVVTNAEHPLNYSAVSTSLLNQNFLVIKAGDGVVSFSCPPDDPSTLFVNGNTLPHQPSS